MRFRKSANLKVEELESRWTPAGNVTASVVGDTVFIDGDPFDNRIMVEASPNYVTIMGEAGTTVNGQTSAVTLTGFPIGAGRPRIVIQTAQGDDFVTLRSFGCGDVSLQTGVGTDVVLVLPGRGFAGNVTIDTEQGDDVIRLLDFNCHGNLSVNCGQGHDSLEVEGLVCLSDVSVDMGEGDDSVSMTGSSSLVDLLIYGALSLDGGPGHRDSLFLDFGLSAPPDEIVIEGFEIQEIR